MNEGSQGSEQLLDQITELQQAVGDMRETFTRAVDELRGLQTHDDELRQQVQRNRTDCQQQTTDIIKLILALKTEFSVLNNRVELMNQMWINHDPHYRDRLEQAGLASQSNDSAVVCDSPSQHHVQQYVSALTDSYCDTEASTDSDSSLILAANKSLTLTTSLGKQCGLELDCSDEEEYKVKDPGTQATTDELVDSERKYCKTLLVLQEVFYQPLRRSAIINLSDLNTLFPEEINHLYEKHCMLLHQLSDSRERPGQVINRFTDPLESDVLRLYTSYVNDFPEVLKTFHKLCRQVTAFSAFIKTALTNPECEGVELGTLLLSPMQRIPSYVLLLKRLMSVTPPESPDYQAAVQCVERLREYLGRLNDSMEHSFQLVTAQISHHRSLPENRWEAGVQCGSAGGQVRGQHALNECRKGRIVSTHVRDGSLFSSGQSGQPRDHSLPSSAQSAPVRDHSLPSSAQSAPVRDHSLPSSAQSGHVSDGPMDPTQQTKCHEAQSQPERSEAMTSPSKRLTKSMQDVKCDVTRTASLEPGASNSACNLVTRTPSLETSACNLARRRTDSMRSASTRIDPCNLDNKTQHRPLIKSRSVHVMTDDVIAPRKNSSFRSSLKKMIFFRKRLHHSADEGSKAVTGSEVRRSGRKKPEVERCRSEREGEGLYYTQLTDTSHLHEEEV